MKSRKSSRYRRKCSGLLSLAKNKTLGRALDPRANGAWLSKLLLNETHEVVILGGQTIDQKLRV